MISLWDWRTYMKDRPLSKDLTAFQGRALCLVLTSVTTAEWTQGPGLFKKGIRVPCYSLALGPMLRSLMQCYQLLLFWGRIGLQPVWYHSYVESKKLQQTSKYNNMAEVDSQIPYREQTSGYQWEGGGTIQGWGRGRYKLLSIREAQGCDAQHRDYSQYLAVTVNGK